MPITYELTVSLTENLYIPMISFSQSNVDSVILDIRILVDREKPLDLTGSTARIIMKAPSNTINTQDCVIDPTEATNGQLSVLLDELLYAETGEHLAEIYIYHNTEVMPSKPFKIRIESGLI